MKTVQSMSPEDKQEKVFRVFEKIAKGYDSANVRISLGMQDSWKKMLIRELTRQDFIPGGCPNGKAFDHTDGGKVKILDLCTGTGDIAIGAAKAGTNYQIIGMDFSPSMLRIAAAKARRCGLDNITWRKGNAMEIPCGDASFDAVSISFGLRNCADPEKVLTGDQTGPETGRTGSVSGILRTGKRPGQALLQALFWPRDAAHRRRRRAPEGVRMAAGIYGKLSSRGSAEETDDPMRIPQCKGPAQNDGRLCASHRM